jgi:hypothetical protein
MLHDVTSLDATFVVHPEPDGHLYMGLDTEGTPHDPWGLTYSLDGIHGYCVRSHQKELLARFAWHIANTSNLILIIHNSLWDIDVLSAMAIEVPEDRFIDTMLYAFFLQLLPQGLKPLSYRLLGSDMKDYEDVIRPYEVKKVNDYLLQAQSVDWEACPVCGARGRKGKEHPEGGAEKWPPEALKKDGMPRKVCADYIPICDGGGAHLLEKLEMVGGELKITRPWTMGRRLKRLVEDMKKNAISFEPSFEELEETLDPEVE